MLVTHPILSCEQSIALEKELLGDSDMASWQAMDRAGQALADAIMSDFLHYGILSSKPRVLIVCGKGHNAGDAFIAARYIREIYPNIQISIVSAFDESAFKPLTKRAFSDVTKFEDAAFHIWDASNPPELDDFDILIDGLFGMQFTAPIRQNEASLIRWVNGLDISFRAAVDLPSALAEEKTDTVLKADFTYATGIAKDRLFLPHSIEYTGRVRYLDIGFFDKKSDLEQSALLIERNLKKLKRLRFAGIDKRDQGHVLLIGGSRQMPGAILMATLGALKSGAGLLTVAVPQNVSQRISSEVPEAMWLSLPSTPDGAIVAKESLQLLGGRMSEFSSVVVGPGMDLKRETRIFLTRLIRETALPFVIDASALQTEIIQAVSHRPKDFPQVVITPHVGEYKRISSSSENSVSDEILKHFSEEKKCICVLKGPTSRITDGERLYRVPFGSPILARGGSGDILSGMIGAFLASRSDALESTSLAVLLHAMASDRLARKEGELTVRTTDLLSQLGPLIRETKM